MLTSIIHRATGVGLYLGALILAVWLAAAAGGEESYAQAQSLLATPFGRLVLLGMTVSVFFHLAKGVQHLVWDLGHGLKLPAANLGAMICMVFAVVATAALWALAALTGALG